MLQGAVIDPVGHIWRIGKFKFLEEPWARAARNCELLTANCERQPHSPTASSIGSSLIVPSSMRNARTTGRSSINDTST